MRFLTYLCAILFATILAANGVQAQCDSEVAKLLASDGASSDYFGHSVAVDGDVMIVGAYRDDDNGTTSGSAYVFQYDGFSWEEAKLLASDGTSGDLFGTSVSIAGDAIVVGAYGDGDGGSASGSAYVFRYDGSDWIQEAKLLASDGAEEVFFGRSVSVAGDAIVVGAGSDYSDESGSVYVFRYEPVGSVWIEEAKLLASDGASGDKFGTSVSIAGDAIVVGAYGDDDSGSASGSAYVFRYDGSDWIEEAKLLDSDGAAEDYFGDSVSIDGDAIVVGAGGDDDNGYYSGSAYVFRYEPVGCVWVEEAKLLPSDGAEYDNFGDSVSIDGDAIVVGARYDHDNGSGSGSAYVFRYEPVASEWVEDAKLLASDAASYDYFGISVSIGGDTIVVGADENNDNGIDSGSAYVYDLSAFLWITNQPENAIAIIDADACFDIYLDTGVGEIVYQWRRDGFDLSDGGKITGAHTDTLCISNVVRNDEATYDVVITDDCGSITSEPAQLYVVDPVLEVTATCPEGGPMSIDWTNATPAGEVALIYGSKVGGMVIPDGHPCAGTRLGLGMASIQIAWQGYAGDDGYNTIYGSAPSAACGGYMQLLDLTTCETSNVVLIGE